MTLAVFRVDASAQIGTGHVWRCVALAQALRAFGADIVFLSRELGVDVDAILGSSGFELAMLPPPDGPVPKSAAVPHAAWAGVDSNLDVEQTSNWLLSRGALADWVLIDHYGFDAQWHRAIAKANGTKVAVIDDTADRCIDAALLIDHNYAPDHAAKYAGLINTDAKILGGPRYALLSYIYGEAKRCVIRTQVASIGVFMGGVDGGFQSAHALAACRSAGFSGRVEIVSTSSNPRLAELCAAVAADGNAELSIDLPDLADFFARHDLQIGAGGGATWERCCIGAPTIAWVVADNQRHVLGPLRNLGVLQMIDGDSKSLTEAIRSLSNDKPYRTQLSVTARRLVDGRGAERVAKYMVDQ
jgi:UDP-2,4-diacetamido-2,4,6-trideoxy-beta-L-altropyranose hydrolase